MFVLMLLRTGRDCRFDLDSCLGAQGWHLFQRDRVRSALRGALSFCMEITSLGYL